MTLKESPATPNYSDVSGVVYFAFLVLIVQWGWICGFTVFIVWRCFGHYFFKHFSASTPFRTPITCILGCLKFSHSTSIHIFCILIFLLFHFVYVPLLCLQLTNLFFFLLCLICECIFLLSHYSVFFLDVLLGSFIIFLNIFHVSTFWTYGILL